MNPRDRSLTCDDAALLADCDVHVYRSSGPGGQHRNKVSSAVRLKHRDWGLSAHADESRSQHANKSTAVKRLRMKIACACRQPVCAEAPAILPVVANCLHPRRDRGAGDGEAAKRLSVGRRDKRFWPVAAFVLDLFDAREGQLSAAADALGISTGNLSAFLKCERHLLAAAQDIRRAYDRKPLR